MKKTWTKVEDYIDTIDPFADHPHDHGVNECIHPYCRVENARDYCGRGCPFGKTKAR
jgi:hypothetical protein